MARKSSKLRITIDNYTTLGMLEDDINSQIRRYFISHYKELGGGTYERRDYSKICDEGKIGNTVNVLDIKEGLEKNKIIKLNGLSVVMINNDTYKDSLGIIDKDKNVIISVKVMYKGITVKQEGYVCADTTVDRCKLSARSCSDLIYKIIEERLGGIKTIEIGKGTYRDIKML